MGKRRKQYISDDGLDSSDGDSDAGSDAGRFEDFDDEDPDERAERLRASGHKRRRKGDGKEEALYGVWAQRDDDDDTRRNGGKSKKSADLRRPQAFVPSTTANPAHEPDGSPTTLEKAVPLPQAMEDTANGLSEEQANGNDDASEDEESDSSDSNSSDEDKPKVRIPRDREAEEELEQKDLLEAAMSSNNQPGAQRGGIGARSRGGIGSSSRATATSEASTIPSTIQPAAASSSTPQASTSGMGAAARERRSFLTGGASNQSSRAGTPNAQPKAAAPISKSEQVHFNKIASQGGFGYKLLAKMGWSAGAGLGASGEGIVTPIESKLRPKAMGLAYEGFKERTKQSKEEEKRRKVAAGEAVSEDDDEGAKKRGRKGKGKEREDSSNKENQRPPAWKQPKARKARVQHMTYEEIVAASAGTSESYTAADTSGVGAIYDLTGNQLSTAALSSGQAHITDVPSSDATRLPELRHNLAIISDVTKGDLDNLAREAKNVKDRRAQLGQEEARVARLVEDDRMRIARLESILQASQQVQKIVTAAGGNDQRTLAEKLNSYDAVFEKLLDTATQEEYEQYRLDEVVIGAIAPAMKRAWVEWDPLQEPLAYLDLLKDRRKLFRLQKRDIEAERAVDLFDDSVYPTRSTLPPRRAKKAQTAMTAFESLLWSHWMPRIRSAINNDWDPSLPDPVIQLYAGWKQSGLLPKFITDNILDQLVLPKVRKAISDWTPPKRGNKGPSLHHIVFPWLEHAGDRMEDMLDEAKRRVRGWLKSWRVRDGVPEGLSAWKDVMPQKDWDNLVLQNVVPQLASHLRDKFTVNPRQQDLAPLTLVLSWRKLLRQSIFTQLLDTHFFSKFLEALYIWLVSPGVNYDQVAQWYSYWKKDVFADIRGVEAGFAKALDLMNQAMALGEDAQYRLKKPETKADQPARKEAVKALPPSRKAIEADITFRSVVEEVAADNNLVFMPTGRSHEKSGMPLYRVSSSIDGRSGVTVYLQGDIVYLVDGTDASKPISVQSMVERARS